MMSSLLFHCFFFFFFLDVWFSSLSLSFFIWISPFRKKTLTDFYEVLWNFSLFFLKKNLFMEICHLKIYSGDLSLEYLFMEICPLKICSGDLSLEYLFMEIFQLKIFSRDLSLWSDIFFFFLKLMSLAF